MQRRRFLVGGAAAAGSVSLGFGLPACSSDPPQASGDTTARARPEGGPFPTIDTPAVTLSHGLDRPNVLFLAVDDMNDWAGFLNPHPGTSTPAMDALAARSLVFTDAYCTAPMCLPSRTGLLWGRQPFHSQVYDHKDPSRQAYASLDEAATSLIASFRDAGYEALGAGKITHDANPRRWDDFHTTLFTPDGHVREDPRWEGRYDPEWRSPYDGSRIGDGQDFTYQQVDFGPSGWSTPDQPDGRSAAWACDQLRRDHDRPFLLAFGTTQPHTPWRVPQEFFDLHPLEDVVVPEHRPEDLDDLSEYVRSTLVDNHRAFQRIREAGIWEEAVQAYQASISFADWCLGQVLDALAASPYADNTIVVLWSDHGFHLGEKLHWHKFTLWERATHVPFLLHVPGATAGERIGTPVSLLDLGPTLAELCGVELDPDHEGASLVPVLADPARGQDRPPLSTWLPGNHSVRQGPYRYIRYHTGDTELYDHRDDPEELHNLAGDAAQRGVIEDLDGYLPPPP